MSVDNRRDALQKKNRVMLFILVFLVLMFFIMTMVRVKYNY